MSGGGAQDGGEGHMMGGGRHPDQRATRVTRRGRCKHSLALK